MPPINQSQAPAKKNTALIVEVVVGIIVIVGGYFGYTMFFADQQSSTQEVSSIQMGKNMASFEKEYNTNKPKFDTSFLDSEFVKSLVDYSQTFTYSKRRGRIDPFVPIESSQPIRYDSTGSIR